ncbi:MAG: phenylphosphate carboxylase subunit alpha, partial [Thermodesulfobacteriota bacterium]
MSYKFYKDNREFIKALESHGELVTIHQEVDWDLEMGAIVRRVCEKRSPAPYFKRIRDYPGFEALGAPLATYSRLAIAMGMDPKARVPEICDEYVRRTSGPPIPPTLV